MSEFEEKLRHADLMAEVERLQRELAAVRELHKPTPEGNWCDHCEQCWPCATARLLGAS